eukprot:TRINITY_DN20047_c1_g1_i2.p2 TRINITY_DN20047_c1_g1~~TRINITY_DN20047_c1_g1_i2.p2  ORF type:complete len:100 (+),score=9.99 TRINITY_DN20047_c1_g1_i2:117-416(+)
MEAEATDIAFASLLLVALLAIAFMIDIHEVCRFGKDCLGAMCSRSEAPSDNVVEWSWNAVRQINNILLFFFSIGACNMVLGRLVLPQLRGSSSTQDHIL